jgi:SAM-dependent methyltransferase
MARGDPMSDTAGIVSHDEAAAVRARYSRRLTDDPRYSLLNSAALLAVQERQRAIAAIFASLGWNTLADRRLLEVGCGTGANLLEFLRMGFRPESLRGIELRPESARQAQTVLPGSVQIAIGDALEAASFVGAGSQDVVYQSTVFSSLLDVATQQKLAAMMWAWTRPGGGVLWYDLRINNPRNPDVAGLPLTRVRQLFPEGLLRVRHITLAPPIARFVTRLHPGLYSFLNASRVLRTHLLVWIAKQG